MWQAETRRVCLDTSPYGACWAGVFVWFERFIYGRYPSEEIWRVNLSWVLFAAWMAPAWFPRVTQSVHWPVGSAYLPVPSRLFIPWW